MISVNIDIYRESASFKETIILFIIISARNLQNQFQQLACTLPRITQKLSSSN